MRTFGGEPTDISNANSARVANNSNNNENNNYVAEDIYEQPDNVGTSTGGYYSGLTENNETITGMEDDIYYSDLTGYMPEQPGNIVTDQGQEEQTDIDIVPPVQATPTGLADSTNIQPVKSKPRLGRAILNVGGTFRRNINQQLRNKIKRAHPIKTVGRFTAQAAGAALFGGAALAVGIASGDPSKAFQYTTAGVVGGSQLGKGIANKVTNSASVDADALGEAALQGYYGEKYKDVITERNEKAWQKDEGNIDFLMKTKGLTRRDAKDFLSGNVAQTCYRNGIEDISDIAAINEMIQRDNTMSLREAMGARYYATKRLPSNIDQTGDANKYINRWAEEYRRAGYGERSEEIARRTFDSAIKFNSAKSGLTKSP